MSLSRALVALCLILIGSWALANPKAIPIPAAMKYFAEKRQYSLNHANTLYLQSLATSKGLEFYPKTPNLLIDALISDSKLEKGILISANSKTNPEFLDRIYQHQDGFFFQIQMQGQQLALFFYGYSEDQVQNTFVQIRKELLISKKIEVFFPEARANSSEVAEAKSSSNIPSSNPSQSPVATHAYALGESFIGCGKGVVEGLNSIARFPWDATVSAVKGAQAWRQDPTAFWARSK